jgi:hypothetical protein
MQAGGGAIRKDLQPNENFVDFNQVQKSVKESAPPSMGSNVLASLKQLASNPATYRNIANIGSLIAAYEGDQGLANTLSTVSNQLEQGITRAYNRPIAAAKLKRDLEDRERKIILDAALENERNTQADKNVADTIKAGKKKPWKPGDKYQIEPSNSLIIKELSKGNLGKPLIRTKLDDKDQAEKYAYNQEKYSIYKKEKREDKYTLVTLFDKADSLAARIKQLKEDEELNNLIGKSKFANINKTSLSKAGLGHSEKSVNFLGNLKTIVSKGFIQELKDMRDAKTGGTGFGSLQKHEFDLLITAIGNLQTDQSPKNFIKNLNTVERQIKKIANAKLEMAQEGYGEDIFERKVYEILSVDQILNEKLPIAQQEPKLKGFGAAANIVKTGKGGEPGIADILRSAASSMFPESESTGVTVTDIDTKTLIERNRFK